MNIDFWYLQFQAQKSIDQAKFQFSVPQEQKEIASKTLDEFTGHILSAIYEQFGSFSSSLRLTSEDIDDLLPLMNSFKNGHLKNNREVGSKSGSVPLHLKFYKPDNDKLLSVVSFYRHDLELPFQMKIKAHSVTDLNDHRAFKKRLAIELLIFPSKLTSENKEVLFPPTTTETTEVAVYSNSSSPDSFRVKKTWISDGENHTHNTTFIYLGVVESDLGLTYHLYGTNAKNDINRTSTPIEKSFFFGKRQMDSQ